MTAARDRVWHEAAQHLVDALARLDSVDPRIDLIESLCERLDGALYPAFVQVLCLVERDGSAAARELMTDTLLHAIVTRRLPSGRVTAWGSSVHSDGFSLTRSRSLGPIEYLCAWRAQPSELPHLGQRAFRTAVGAVVRLVSADPRARRLYCEKLMADVRDPLEGDFARWTRYALGAMAEAWQRSNDASLVIEAFERAMSDASVARIESLESNPFA